MVHVRYGGGWGCFLIGAIVVVLLFYLIRALLYLLYVASPILLIAAIVLNWRAVWDTLREFWALLLERPLLGLITMVLAVVFYPVTATYLFLRALGYRNMEQTTPLMTQRWRTEEGEYIEFEEIESRSAPSVTNSESPSIEPLTPPDDLPPASSKA
ncbi:MAG: hypothetical protein NZM43_00385 [Saprospiraceae bacterium]|nr:hypothetical protein [Saprospiraceae bacterium]MDW8482758.1 hypothetical protein [Saprospiraceae bacterium]